VAWVSFNVKVWGNYLKNPKKNDRVRLRFWNYKIPPVQRIYSYAQPLTKNKNKQTERTTSSCVCNLEPPTVKKTEQKTHPYWKKKKVITCLPIVLC